MSTDFIPEFIQIGNGEAIARERIPHLAFEDFRSQALQIVANGGKVVQFFAYPDGDKINLLAILRSDHLLLAGCRAPEAYPSLTIECEPFHMFEREIAEQFGIRPEGHPWLKRPWKTWHITTTSRWAWTNAGLPWTVGGLTNSAWIGPERSLRA